MTYRQFLTQVERGQISPFYLFEGEEEYFKKEALENLKSKLISNNKDFDYQRMNAAFHSGREILELACQLPFDNKWQIVVVEDAEKLDSKDEEIIRDYFKKPVDSTCMVLMGKKFNFQSKLYKFFKKEDKLVLFYPLRERQAVNWIKEKVKKEEKSITDEAAIELSWYLFLIPRTLLRNHTLPSLSESMSKKTFLIFFRLLNKRIHLLPCTC